MLVRLLSTWITCELAFASAGILDWDVAGVHKTRHPSLQGKGPAILVDDD
jgi:hypothetical protein